MIAVVGEISWHSTLSACVSNFGSFLEFCKCSSLSDDRLWFMVVFDIDDCRVVRRSTIGDVCVIGWSRLVDESNKASSDPSDNVDCGVWQWVVVRR